MKEDAEKLKEEVAKFCEKYNTNVTIYTRNFDKQSVFDKSSVEISVELRRNNTWNWEI